MASRKPKSPSLIESHNALPLSTIRSAYLRPEPSLHNETHTVTLETSSSISSTAFNACFELVRDNMQDMYRRSDMGWSATRKKKEMRHPAMRFLLLRARPEAEGSVGSRDKHGGEEEEGTKGDDDWEDDDVEEEDEDGGGIVGFLSFMVTVEVKEVIYCYELHIGPNSRGSGLGKHLLGVMEDFGRAVGVGKAMLTCFAENEDAKRFYNHNGYEMDEISPETRRLRNGRMKQPSYYILSKVL